MDNASKTSVKKGSQSSLKKGSETNGVKKGSETSVKKDGDEKSKQNQSAEKKILTPSDKNDILTELDKKNEHDRQKEQENKVLVNQIQELVQELKSLELENEKLKEKHEQKVGISMDSIQRTKEELDRARATNRFLMENAETRKTQCGKLETQNFELKMKLESLKKQFGEMTKTNVELAGEVNELLKERLEFQKVVEENERLKALVKKFNIDVNTGRIVNQSDTIRSQIEAKRSKKPQNQKTSKSGVKEPMTERTNRPLPKEKPVRSAKSLEDIRKQVNSETGKSDTSDIETLYPRSYLGLHNKQSTKHRRT